MIFHEEIEKAFELESDDNFAINKEKADLCAEIYKTFKEIGGKVTALEAEPRFLSCSFEMEFDTMHIDGYELNKLLGNLNVVSALSITPLLNGNISISVTIPDLYIRKTKDIL